MGDVAAICSFGPAHIPAHYKPLLGAEAACAQVENWWTTERLSYKVQAERSSSPERVVSDCGSVRAPSRRGATKIIVRPSGERVAKVDEDRLERFKKVNTRGIYDGVQVSVQGESQRVPVYVIGNPKLAKEHGFEGSHHDGWHGTVSLDEITDIEELVTDLLDDDRPTVTRRVD